MMGLRSGAGRVEVGLGKAPRALKVALAFTMRVLGSHWTALLRNHLGS